MKKPTKKVIVGSSKGVRKERNFVFVTACGNRRDLKKIDALVRISGLVETDSLEEAEEKIKKSLKNGGRVAVAEKTKELFVVTHSTIYIGTVPGFILASQRYLLLVKGGL